MTDMPRLNQGSFTITIDSTVTKVMLGEGHSSKNQIPITITNTGAQQPRVRVTVIVKCGSTSEALLDAITAKVIATYNTTGNPTGNLSAASSSADCRSWQTPSRGVAVDSGKQLSINLFGFEANTPPGDAVIDVLVQIYRDGVWSPPLDAVPEADRTLKVAKVTAGEPTDSKIHYFTVNPDYILHAGQTPVAVSFYASGFDRLTLFRNNQEVQNWRRTEQSPNKSITGTFSDKPSITTVYRLEGKPNTENANDATIERIRYRTVQIISPGWNQISLPQGYPARLFVNTDFSGSGMLRLYGIFIGSDGKAALYSSATGVDDWRLEPGDVPPEMATSPGVAYQNKLWLIGGSCVDQSIPGSEVWSYEIDKETNEAYWKRQKDFPMKPRMGHACVVFPRRKDGKIVEELWVIGGFNNGNLFGDAWKLADAEGNDWIQLSPSGTSWPARYMHAAVSFTYDSDQQAEVRIYGGTGESGQPPHSDMWTTTDGGVTWSRNAPIVPPPGAPFGAALVAYNISQAETSQRMFLGGTFLEPAASGESNRTSSFIFEWQWRNEKWEARPVGDGWERFEGSRFYMQAIAFNRFLLVWSLHKEIDASTLPKLNILIS